MATNENHIKLPMNKPPTHGILLATCAIFLASLGGALILPFLQSQRTKIGCDVICYGNMQSVRSGLALFGSAFGGRLSDQLDRKSVLWIGLVASLLSYVITTLGDTITIMWLSMIPAALFNQSYGVFKALFSDYQEDIAASESQRSASLGKLGMVVGIAYMIGPLVGTTFLTSYREATISAVALSLLSGTCLLLLPLSNTELKRITSRQEGLNTLNQSMKSSSLFPNLFQNILSFVSIPVAQTSGAKLLFVIRGGLGIAFHVFMTVWPTSLQRRFNFEPAQHAYLMAWVGFWYAISQGVLAQRLISLVKEDTTVVITLCMAVLGLGRVLALLTESILTMYGFIATVIVALGVTNTALSSACSRLAGADQVGGLFGIMEAVEGVAGLTGPLLGGFLYRIDTYAPVIAMIVIYCILFVLVVRYYNSLVMNRELTIDNKVKSA